MAKHQILFSRKNNENATTALDPVAPWANQVDLNETGTFCASADWDMLVTEKLYQVREIDLPDWMSADEWCRSYIEWKYVWASGVEREWPQTWQRGLAKLSFADRFSACKLLRTKNFKSAFRKSLRDQIVAWLEAPAEARKFASPLSERQWSAIAEPSYRAKRAEEAAYRDRGWA